jgi:hypothetical protein
MGLTRVPPVALSPLAIAQLQKHPASSGIIYRAVQLVIEEWAMRRFGDIPRSEKIGLGLEQPMSAAEFKETPTSSDYLRARMARLGLGRGLAPIPK